MVMEQSRDISLNYLFVKSDNDVGRITRILPAICTKRNIRYEMTAREVTHLRTEVQK